MEEKDSIKKATMESKPKKTATKKAADTSSDYKETVNNEDASKVEQVKGKGEEVISKVKKLIKEGNVRKIIVKDKDEKIIAEFPLTFGVLGAMIAPALAALFAIVALVKDCSIYVEKK